jgi:hypothetical protein
MLKGITHKNVRVICHLRGIGHFRTDVPRQVHPLIAYMPSRTTVAQPSNTRPWLLVLSRLQALLRTSLALFSPTGTSLPVVDGEFLREPSVTRTGSGLFLGTLPDLFHVHRRCLIVCHHSIAAIHRLIARSSMLPLDAESFSRCVGGIDSSTQGASALVPRYPHYFGEHRRRCSRAEMYLEEGMSVQRNRGGVSSVQGLVLRGLCFLLLLIPLFFPPRYEVYTTLLYLTDVLCALWGWDE